MSIESQRRNGSISGMVNRLGHAFRKGAAVLYRYSDSRYMPRMVILGALVGVVGGLGAVGFHHLILGFKYLFYGATSTETFLDAVLALPWQYRLVAPALGGLIVGPLVTYVVKEARGHGVPEVMEAVALRGGKIRFRVVPLKALLSAICIGSGGSAGREGPIVQIGAAFGSAVGGYLRLTPEKVETLLAAGAAAGIGGTFNAPLAGVIFSLEVLLKRVKLDSFSPIVVAAVVGTAVANSLFGRTGPIFDIPVHELVTYWELFFYLGLGLLGAAVALLYGNSLYRVEHLFEKIRIPIASKAALGGLLLGALALVIPQIHSTGYPVMESALHGLLPLQLVFALMLAKILATCLTLGSGGSGGIFAPGLFIGAMMGSTYGIIVHSFFPGITAGASSYAMVGMGTVFAGATHAPLTAIIILFEMTRDPRILLPMMLTCIVSSAVAARLQKRNIYTTKLLNRGVDIEEIESQKALTSLNVGEAMNTHFVTLSESTPVAEAEGVFRRTFSDILPVVEERTGKLTGLLEYRNVIHHLIGEHEENTPVADIADIPPAGVHEADTLLEALKRLEHIDLPIIPVLADDGSQRIVGMLSRRTLKRARPRDWFLYLSSNKILPDIQAEDRESAIAEICTAAAESTPGFSPAELTEAVLQRENLMSTALDREVAFPHAQLAGLKYPVVMLARSARGIEWGAHDGRAVRLIFMAFTPQEDEGRQVQIARGIAAAIRDEQVREDLLKGKTAAVMLARMSRAMHGAVTQDNGE